MGDPDKNRPESLSLVDVRFMAYDKNPDKNNNNTPCNTYRNNNHTCFSMGRSRPDLDRKGTAAAPFSMPDLSKSTRLNR